MHDEAVGGAERFQSHLRAMSRNTPDRTNLLAEVPTLIKDGMEKNLLSELSSSHCHHLKHTSQHLEFQPQTYLAGNDEDKVCIFNC